MGEILPWDDIEEEAEKLLASRRKERRASDINQANQQRDDELVGDETESYDEVIFGQRRSDSLAIDWTSKTVCVLEFKRTSDQMSDYRERGESRALAQHAKFCFWKNNKRSIINEHEEVRPERAAAVHATRMLG